MSAFSRFINTPASRRSYSSYFSSKSGGGRYFNSAKAPKNGVVATNGAPKPETASSEAQADGGVQTAPSSSPLADTQASSSGTTAPSEGPTTTPGLGSTLTELSAAHQHMPQLAISAKDFKMHQFFSLHRPLLLINQPATIFRGVAHGQPLFGPPPSASAAAGAGPMQVAPHHLGLDSPLDPFVDADAEAARQLTRALTMARAESALAWENTLKHLGLDVAKDVDRVGLQAQFEREWAEVLLDSTKRKRRKKMKKHKLKKRRRATRSERLKMK